MPINLFDFATPVYGFISKEGKPCSSREETNLLHLPVPAAVIIGSWFSMAKEEPKDAPQNGKSSENI